MIKNEDKIKSVEQLLNIVFDNDENEIKNFYSSFKLQREWKFEEQEHEWSCRFKSRCSDSELEIGFNDSEGEYGGEISGTECGEENWYWERSRGGESESIWDSIYKTKKTFYREIKSSFFNIVELIEKAENEEYEESDEEIEAYENKCLDKFGHTDLTQEEEQELQDEIEGEATYRMMVREGWIDED